MNGEPGPETEAKRQILVGLTGALAALSDRMRSHGEAAKRITILAARAEQIAQRSWDLNTSANKHFQRDSQQLLTDIKSFAKEVVDAAERATKDALLGREVAAAIAAHSEDIGKLARDIKTLPDAAAVRARLRPLSVTLSALPERLKANAATINDVKGIATLAKELAERGDRFATDGAAGAQEAVALCRDLRRFSEEATAVSLEMTRGSALAVQVINDLAGKTVSLAQGKPVSDVPATAHDRMMALARDRPGVTQVWVSAVAKPDKNPVPAAAQVWT